MTCAPVVAIQNGGGEMTAMPGAVIPG